MKKCLTTLILAAAGLINGCSYTEDKGHVDINPVDGLMNEILYTLDGDKVAEHFGKTCNMPENLIDFLMEKRVSIRVVDGSLVYLKEKVGTSGSFGLYNGEINQITLPDRLDEAKGIGELECTTLHEVGHVLFEEGDGIFDNTDYEGPTKNDFIKEIQRLQKRRSGYSCSSVDEVFARAFSKYIRGIGLEDSLEILFSQMNYNGKPLKN